MDTPPPNKGKTFLELFLVFFAALCCCGFLGLYWLASRDVHSHTPLTDTSHPLESIGSRGLHLGLVLVPPSTPPSEAQFYEWRVEALDPPEYRLGYGLGSPLAKLLEREHRMYGRKMHFRQLSRARFTYQAPPECQTDMRCIYAELMRSNAGPVRELGKRFVQHIHTQRLDPVAAAELIITFIQRIHYAEPDNQPFGILPPALVAAQDQGDCDSKAVLAVMLLRQAGIDAAILYSDPLSHAAVGVALPVRGPPIRLGDRVYRYAELTTEGWPLGMIPPQHDKPHLWKALPPPELPDTSDLEWEDTE